MRIVLQDETERVACISPILASPSHLVIIVNCVQNAAYVCVCFAAVYGRELGRVASWSERRSSAVGITQERNVDMQQIDIVYRHGGEFATDFSSVFSAVSFPPLSWAAKPFSFHVLYRFARFSPNIHKFWHHYLVDLGYKQQRSFLFLFVLHRIAFLLSSGGVDTETEFPTSITNKHVKNYAVVDDLKVSTLLYRIQNASIATSALIYHRIYWVSRKSCKKIVKSNRSFFAQASWVESHMGGIQRLTFIRVWIDIDSAGAHTNSRYCRESPLSGFGIKTYNNEVKDRKVVVAEPTR